LHTQKKKFVCSSLPRDALLFRFVMYSVGVRILPALLSTTATGNKLILIYAVPNPHIEHKAFTLKVVFLIKNKI